MFSRESLSMDLVDYKVWWISMISKGRGVGGVLCEILCLKLEQIYNESIMKDEI